jgi:predicted phage tail protein
MKTIILNGQLGKMFGRRHRLDVKTAAEAVRALVANFPPIEKYLIETRGVGYRVKLHDAPLQDIKELHHPVGGGTISITPVIGGAGRGLGQILLGAALIAVSFIPGLNVAVWAGATTTWASIAFSVGFSLALGGVAQMLAPSPKTGAPNERPENNPSYIFNGPVNTTAQGQPVPVGYGRLIVGGAVVSAGLSTEEIPV